MELATFGRALRKNWWLSLAITVFFTLIAAALAFTTSPTYQSSVTFYVTPSGPTTGNAVQDQQAAILRVTSYISLVSSRDLATRIVEDKTGGSVGLSTDKVTSELSASTALNAVTFTVTVLDSSKARALLIAQKVEKHLPLVVQSVESSSPNSNILHVPSSATVQNSPVAPRKGLYIGLGLLAGLALGLAAAFLRGALDKSLRDADDVRAIGLSPVGDVAFERSVRRAPLVVPGDPEQAVRSEEYRKIRTNLRFMDVDSPTRVISVSSAVAEEGKSTTAANLAIVLAEAEGNVVLVEADLRRPRMSEYLGLESAVGLTNVLVGEVPLDAALQRWGDSLAVLPCGTLPPNPSELLGSSAMRELIDTLRGRFSVVVIDTPPLVPVTDGAVVAAQCDGTLLVVRHGKTSKVFVQSAVETLRAVEARVLGVVLSMRKKREGGKKAQYATRYTSVVADSVVTPPPPASGAAPTRPAVNPPSDPSDAEQTRRIPTHRGSARE